MVVISLVVLRIQAKEVTTIFALHVNWIIYAKCSDALQVCGAIPFNISLVTSLLMT